MKIKYYNHNLNLIHNNTDIDRSIIDIILKQECLNIVHDKNLLDLTIKTANKFSLNKKKIIVFGTGGSNLGARSLCEVIQKKKLDIEFHDNIDPNLFTKSFTDIDFNSTGFLIISKSGSTPETLAQFSCLYQQALQKNKLEIFLKNILIITEFNESPLYKIAKENNCLLLEHNNSIGGRYSVFSNVGIVPAIISGLNVTLLYRGVLEVLNNIDTYINLNVGKYLCFQDKIKYQSSVIMTYSDLLFFTGKWYLQLWAESIGKKNKGITPIHAVGTTDQHSQLQLYLHGPKDKFFTFITTDHKNKGLEINSEIFKNTNIDYFKNKKIGDLMEAEQRATLETFNLNKFFFREIYLPTIDEENLGKLLAFSIIETISSCIYLDVNPFDQPAVEQGKILTKDYLR